MYSFRPYHEVTEDIVRVTQIIDQQKVECLADFGKLYVFTVDEENVLEIEKSLRQLEEMKSGSDEESSSDMAVFAVAPNARSKKFMKIRISQ